MYKIIAFSKKKKKTDAILCFELKGMKTNVENNN